MSSLGLSPRPCGSQTLDASSWMVPATLPSLDRPTLGSEGRGYHTDLTYLSPCVPSPSLVGCERHEGGVSHLSGVSRAPRGAWHNEGAWLEMGFGMPTSFLPSSCLLCWHLGLHIRSSAHLSGASVPGMLPDSKAG